MAPKDILEKLLSRQNLSRLEMCEIMQHIIEKSYDDVFLGAFLVALRAKGETADELLGACDVLYQHAHLIDVPTQKTNHANHENFAEHIVDIVGTGGDHQQSFNISTAAMLVAASAGAYVAKHGGRSVSSRSGSADCLEALGITLPSPEKVAQYIQEVGAGFMFAPHHHPAMRSVAGIRKTLGIRTIFNLLGPLLNPAKTKRILLGVYDEKWVQPLTHVLAEQSYLHAWVVCANGLDEISSISTTQIGEVKNGHIQFFTINPKDYGFNQNYDFKEIQVDSPEDSAQLILDIFEQRNQALARDMVVINAAAALYIGGVVTDLAAGIEKAKQAINEGATYQTLQKLRAC